MRSTTLLSASLVLVLLACTSEETPTEPGRTGDVAPAVPSLALASNTWTAKAPIPGPRAGVSAGVVPNSSGQSILYVLGGFYQDGDKYEVEAFDVATNTWTGKASYTYYTRLNGVGRIGTRLYFSGGFAYNDVGYSARLYAYDPASDRMIRKRDMPLHTADGVTGVINGKLYVLPGTCSTEGWPEPGYCEFEPIRKLYRYDPAANVWTKQAWCPHFHKNGAGGVINGKFYVAGGFNHSDNPATPVLDVYDPTTNSWRTLAPLPTAGQAIGAVLGGKLFVIVSSETGLHAYAYDPANNTWKAKAAPKFGHDAVARVLVDGKPYLLAVGGIHYPDIDNDSELYTP
jgi:N-acetylneuraminic acid mutarotase